MTDEEAPLRYAAAPTWHAEMERRRQIYADRRRRWTEAWFRGDRPDPALDEPDGTRRSGRTIHDRRQFRFDI